MHQINKLFIIALLIFILPNCNIKESKYNEDWMAHLNEAKKEGKYLILEFYTTWCIPCKTLDVQVWGNDTLMNILKHKSNLLKVDAEKDIGLALAIKYGVAAYPTLLIFDTTQTVVYEKIGIDGIARPDDFLNFINSIIDGKRKLPAKGLSLELMANSAYPPFYIQRLKDRILPDSTIVNDYFRRQNNPYSEINWSIIRVLAHDSMQNFVTKHANKYFNLYGCMLTSLFSKRIQTELSEDIRTGDTMQFKRHLDPYLSTLNEINPSELPYRKSLIQLNFWSKNGYWNKFITIWGKYRSTYGNDIDVKAAQYIAERCNKQTVRNLAEQILAEDITQSPHNWEQMVSLANIWEMTASSESTNESEIIIFTNKESKHRNPDSLYTLAINEAKGDQQIISRIVGMRLQAAKFIPNKTGWQSALLFFKKYKPREYAEFHNFLSANYYKEQNNWKLFAQSADKFFKNKFQRNATFTKLANQTNAHTLYSYAKTIRENSTTIDQIKLAISWIEYLTKIYSKTQAYAIEQKKLKIKLDSVKGIKKP